MTLIIPYVLPLLLGKTYDYNTASPGVDIFSPETIRQHRRVIDRATTDSKFKLVETLTDVSKLLDVKGEFSMNVLAGVVNAQASGSYFKSREDRENSVEILVNVKHETYTETLNSMARPVDKWKRYGKDQLGTHFVRSVTYGGELIASVKFIATTAGGAKRIQGSLSAGVGIEGSISASVAGAFKKIEESMKSSTKVEISYYATVPVGGVPHSIEGLQALIKDFPNQVRQSGVNGKGIPIKVELFPLGSLDMTGTIGHFQRSSDVGSKIKDVSNMYGDVVEATTTLKKWVAKLDDLTPQTETMIGDFNTKLGDIEYAFLTAILSMDVSSSGSSTQFDTAMAEYRGKANFIVPGKYVREFRDLKKKVEVILSGIPECSFSAPLANVGVLKANIINVGKSKLVREPVDIVYCKKLCLKDPKCSSITYYRQAGSSGAIRTSSDKCYINTVSIGQDTVVPVPHRGSNDILIYDRNRSGGC